MILSLKCNDNYFANIYAKCGKEIADKSIEIHKYVKVSYKKRRVLSNFCCRDMSFLILSPNYLLEGIHTCTCIAKHLSYYDINFSFKCVILPNYITWLVKYYVIGDSTTLEGAS